uniref:Uncharacterized protein n=1 Tax=Micrurus lemniscatus lemniscatus TaxID=129467 RepID=A0A2D4HYC9_MICLE
MIKSIQLVTTQNFWETTFILKKKTHSSTGRKRFYTHRTDSRTRNVGFVLVNIKQFIDFYIQIDERQLNSPFNNCHSFLTQQHDMSFHPCPRNHTGTSKVEITRCK